MSSIPNRLGVTSRKMKLRTMAASLAIIAIFLASGILGAVPRVYAFANGQNASIVIGQPNFTSKYYNSSNINQSRLSTPYDAKIDSSGNLWVVDASNSRVLEFKAPFSNGESASLVLGESSFTTSYLGGSTTVNGTVLATPEAMAFDSSGNIWVSDTGDARIVEFTAPFSTGENASLVLGQPDLKTANTNQPASQTDLNGPIGMAFDSSGNLWVADTGSYRVVEFKAPFSNGESASIVLGQNNFTAKDFANEPGCPPNCGASYATKSTLDGATDVAFDSSGNLWVADRNDHRVVEFTPPFSNGQAGSVIVGGGCAIFGGLLGANCLSVTEFLAFDHSGMLWVYDTGNGRVLGFPSPITNGENASVVLGQPDFATTYGPNWNVTQSILISPEGIAFDSSGNLWVADSGGTERVLEFAASVTASSSAAASSSSTSSTITISSPTTSLGPVSTTLSTPTSASTSAVQTSTTPTAPPSVSSSSSSGSTSISPSYVLVVIVVLAVMVGVGLFSRKRR